jgi:hypothetical protein
MSIPTNWGIHCTICLQRLTTSNQPPTTFSKHLIDIMMSTEEEAAAADDVCASCGTAAVDNVKLKKCACDLVKYCSVNCQKNHRPQHKKMCRKRLAELRDNDLFEQPENSHLGECPLCCLPIPLDGRKSTIMPCCSKTICNGCNYANMTREFEAGMNQHKCAFCREPKPNSREEADKHRMKRVKKNDPMAIYIMGELRLDEGDYEGALDYMTKAAGLGVAEAHYSLLVMYHNGEGVEKNKEKEIYHMEEAAIGGHPTARRNLGIEEGKNGRFDRAKKHFIIAANLGHNDSLQELKKLYSHGFASKEEYASALRAYQAAVDETKSSEREKAEEAIKNGLLNNLHTT